jgi:hypothetical protein
LVYHSLLYALLLVGVWTAWKRQAWQLLVLTGVPILYTVALTMISQVSAMDKRTSTPIRIPVIILAAFGLNWVWPRARQRIFGRPASA